MRIPDVAALQVLVAWLTYFNLLTVPCTWADTTALMHRGAHLPAALADVDVTTILVMGDVKFQEEDWAGMQLPVVLARNVTVQAAPGLGYMPQITFNGVSNKIQLLPDIEFTWMGLAMDSPRSGFVRATPGLDLLADSPTPQAGQGRAVYRMLHTMSTQRLCQPASVQVNASQAAPRPVELPGQQTTRVEPNPPNCSTSPTARMVDRCYKSRTRHLDIALVSRGLDAVGGQVPTNYLVHGVDALNVCEAQFNATCLANHTATECWTMAWNEMVANASISNGSSNGSGSGGGGGGGSGPLYAIIPAAVIGGLAVVTLVVGTLVLLRSRSRLRHQASHTRCPPAEKQYAAADGLQPQTQATLLTTGGNTTSGAESGSEFMLLGTRSVPQAAAVWGHGAAAASSGGPHASQTGSGADSGRLPPPSCALVRSAAPLTERSPFCAHVRLDLRWGVDVVADNEAVRGAGAFGRVVEGTYQGSKVAVKVLHLTPQQHAAPARAVESLQQEAHVLGRCSHPNIVRVVGACLQPPHLCLVMELMDQSLAQLLAQAAADSPGSLLPLQQVMGIAMDIVAGLVYLHPTVVHRDLKPANVLLAADGTAKLSDFGLARLRETVCETKHPEAGTAPYMAPECFDPTTLAITHKADIYSFAVVLWQLLAGTEPWHGLNTLAIAFAVAAQQKRPPMWAIKDERCTSKLRQLLAECWDADPQRRPSAEEILKRLAMVRQGLHRAAAGTGTRDSSGSAASPSAASSRSVSVAAAAVAASSSAYTLSEPLAVIDAAGEPL